MLPNGDELAMSKFVWDGQAGDDVVLSLSFVLFHFVRSAIECVCSRFELGQSSEFIERGWKFERNIRIN